MKSISMKSLFEQTFVPDDSTSQLPESFFVEGDGVPVFTEQDVVQTPYKLDRMIRGIFVKHGITRQIFSHRHREYATRVLGLQGTQINTDKGNLLKAMFRGNISMTAFQRVLQALGYQITDITITVVDHTGTLSEFKLTDMYHKQ